MTENLPRESAGAYFENEYGQDDVNKFEDLLAEGIASRSLFAATDGQPERMSPTDSATSYAPC